MSDTFTIYVDRLKADSTEELDGSLSPDFLSVADALFSFPQPIYFTGKAYLADTHLVVQLSLETVVSRLCKICNEPFLTPLKLDNLYFTEELANIPSHICDMKEWVRESILLDIPIYGECGGECPARKELNHFFKTP